jgi:hypothetical protein
MGQCDTPAFYALKIIMCVFVNDPLNLQKYQENFSPLKLSTEAKASADAAKAKSNMG